MPCGCASSPWPARPRAGRPELFPFFREPVRIPATQKIPGAAGRTPFYA